MKLAHGFMVLLWSVSLTLDIYQIINHIGGWGSVLLALLSMYFITYNVSEYLDY